MATEENDLITPGGNNNPHDFEPRFFDAKIGGLASFSGYQGSYDYAVGLLYGQIANGKQPIDMVALPLLFIMRHSLELGYKYRLEHLYEVCEEGTYRVKGTGHSLMDLHRDFERHVEKACKLLPVSGGSLQDIKHHMALTEKAVQDFDKTDFDSMTFGSPSDRKGVPTFHYAARINLLEVKEAYDAAMPLLFAIKETLPMPGRE